MFKIYEDQVEDEKEKANIHVTAVYFSSYIKAQKVYAHIEFKYSLFDCCLFSEN